MKKTFTLIAFAGVLAIAACGPSAEKIKRDKQVADSTAKAMEAEKNKMMDQMSTDTTKANSGMDTTKGH